MYIYSLKTVLRICKMLYKLGDSRKIDCRFGVKVAEFKTVVHFKKITKSKVKYSNPSVSQK